jgi:hypothetical protein
LTGYRAKTAASIVIAVALAVALGALVSFNYPAEATKATQAGATFSIQIVNGSTLAPVAGLTVFAGPATSPSDVVATWGGPTLAECVHIVQNGSVVEGNGSVLFPNGTLVTFPPCSLKEYVTDSSGWVHIRNVTSDYYFVRAVNVMQENDVIIGFNGTSVVNLSMPWPSGKVTLTQSSSSANCAVSYSHALSGVEILYEACSSSPT